MWRRALVFGLLSVAALPLAAWLVHPWPIALRWADPQTTAYMEYRLEEARAAGYPLEITHSWIPLTEIPPELQRAVLIAEDDRFYEHRGVDWEALAEEVRYRGTIPPSLRDPADRAAIAEAFTYLREHRGEVRGRSTLTQQLARNLYLSPDRSFVRKGQELIIAQRLEWFLPKDRILELYLNIAEFGPGLFGVQAAAERYFGIPASSLSLRQAASLAATLPHPLTSNPDHRPAQMAWRRDLILQRMGGGLAPAVPNPLDEPQPVPSPPESDSR